jgi:hypothetical protein
MLFRRITLAFSLLLGLVGSQIPEFAQQYRQRLGGAIDELNRIVAQFDADATAKGLTPGSALERLKSDNDSFVAQHGQTIDQDFNRLQRLTQQRDSFAQAGPVSRIFVLIRDFDPSIASNAMRDYEPAVPTTGEGFIAAFFGFFLGGGMLHLLAWPVRRRARLKARTRG